MRRGIAAGAALTIAMLAVMPMQVAVGAKPHRDPIMAVGSDEEFSFIIRDRETPCPFAMLLEAEGIWVDWTFSDGHEASTNIYEITFTNLETGTTYEHRSSYHRSITYAADGREHVVIDGTFWENFAEGDGGPEGEVGPGGASFFLAGQQSYVYSPRTDAITSFEFEGQAIDACEVLA